MNPYDERLAQFANDEVLFNAVKSVLEVEFDLNIAVSDHSNQELAEIVRGILDGRRLLQRGFKQLERFRRTEQVASTNTNPAV